jgi:hypothetical protein
MVSPGSKVPCDHFDRFCWTAFYPALNDTVCSGGGIRHLGCRFAAFPSLTQPIFRQRRSKTKIAHAKQPAQQMTGLGFRLNGLGFVFVEKPISPGFRIN